MRINRIKARGIGTHHGDIELPISELGDAKLVAIVGNNGAGKTTAIELVPGAIYRDMPSRSSMAKMAKGKDSFIELDLETTRHATMRLMMDGTKKPMKSEGIITDGEETLAAGKLAEYDKKVGELFPEKDLFLASAFAVQGGAGSFLNLEVSKRKAMFVKMLGGERLQAIADAASKEAAKVDKKIDGIRGEIAAIARRREDRDDLLTKIGYASKRVEASELAVQNLVQRIERARKEAESWRELSRDARDALDAARKQLDAAKAKRRERQDEATKAAVVVDGLRRKIKQLEEKLERRDGLDVIAMEHDAIEAEIASLEAQRDDQQRADAEHAKELHAWRDRVAEIEGRLAQIDRESSQLTSEARVIDAWVREANAAVKRLDGVPCGGAGEFAACHFIRDAAEKRGDLDSKKSRFAVLSQQIEDLGARRSEERERLDKEKLERPDDYEVNEDFAGRISALRRKLKAATDAKADLAALGAVEGELEARKDELDAAHKEAEERIVAVKNAEADELSAVDMVHSAEARVNDLPAEPERVELIERSMKSAEGDLLMARDELAVLRRRLDADDEAGRDHDEASARLAGEIEHLDDWTHLASAFGKNGIQALEIDAAGPGVSALTNELLHACYGTRFTAALETQRLKADGKAMTEIFDLRVIDSQEGTDGSAGDLSGGEKVIVQEALSLAIAIYNCERSEIPLKTIFRDECSGALSRENAVRYVEMLRKGIELGGFERCYFIAHQPELWDLADKRMVFEKGDIFVV